MTRKLQIILLPEGAGTMKRLAIDKPFLVFGLCCAVLWIAILSYIVADYRSMRGPWRELLCLEQENEAQKERIRFMTEEILQVAQQLGEISEKNRKGKIGERLLETYDDVQEVISSASNRNGSQSRWPVRESYRSLVREMHSMLDSLDRELDTLAVLYNPKVVYAMGGSSSEARSVNENREDLDGVNRTLIESRLTKSEGKSRSGDLQPLGTAKLSLIERRLTKIAREVGIAPGLALSMAKVESRFDHNAVSPRGAIGVLQVMPHVAWEGYEVTAEKLFDPEVNIRVGLTFMKSLLLRFDHNVDLSLAAYNAGPTRVVEAGYQIPPIRQTQEYVKRVKQAMNEYGPLYWLD